MRLEQQRKTLLRNSELTSFYEESIQHLLDTDKLEIVDKKADSIDGRVFYISHIVTR